MGIIFIASAILILQSLLGYMQVRYYQHFMRNITNKYVGMKHYHLYSTMERQFMRGSAIALIVVDGNANIQECYTLQGKSIFAKFKYQPQFLNQNLAQMRIVFQQEQENRKLFLWEKALMKSANNAIN